MTERLEQANRRYLKGVPFLSKMGNKKGKGFDLGAEPSRIKLF